MKQKLIVLAAVALSLSASTALMSSQQTAEATPQIATMSIDLTAYSDAEALNLTNRADDCQVFNPGTPFCYQMCTTQPRLRTCDED